MIALGGVDRAASVLYAGVFLDLFGFGMLIPDIQLRSERMGAPGWLIGVILAATFAVQVPVSPFWGKLSDRMGRKPVYLLCTACSAGGMFAYGFASGVPGLLVSRILSGAGGANVAIAQAILADRSESANRTVAMARISAAISLGLIGGPVAGGIIARTMGSEWVGYVAGIGSAVGALAVAFVLPSGLQPRDAGESAASAKWPDVGRSLLRDLPRVRGLVILTAISWFALATLEGTFGRLIERTLGFGQLQFGVVFGYESLVSFAVQVWLIKWVTRRLTDPRLLCLAYILQGVGLALTPFTYLYPVRVAWLGVLLIFSSLYALGSALANPTINSLCSQLAPENRQGELFGVLQGARSIGFIFGPIIGGALFDRWFAAPYLLAGITCVATSALLGVVGVSPTSTAT
jgi:DHA1 family tetracycline resistance protein-like MFS transporter